MGCACNSCNKGENSAWDQPIEYFSERISDYHNSSIGGASVEKEGNQAVYVDFSDGLCQAYDEETNKKVIDYIGQILKSDVSWYALDMNQGGISPMQFSDYREIYNKITDPKKYDGVMAPIEKALERITAGKNDALLITDFEEYLPDGKEQGTYSKNYFTKWCKTPGSSIRFYYQKYHEKNKKSRLEGDKNLYFTVFSYGPAEEGGLLDKFEKAIKNRPELGDLKSFELNKASFPVSNDYGGKDKTGLCPPADSKSSFDVGDKSGILTYYHNGLDPKDKSQSGNFEALEFGCGMDILSPEFTENKNFTKGLFVDASKSITYVLKPFKVQVVNVTEDYKHFVQCQEAQKVKPVIKDAPGGEKVWDDDSKNNPIISTCYFENSTRLRGDYKYSYKEGEQVNEVFDTDVDFFNKCMKNQPEKVELITKFHTNFSPSKLNEIDNGEPFILRVDYIVNSETNYPDQLNDFKWESVVSKDDNGNRKENISLYELIRGAIQDLNSNDILYSYYLKLYPNKK